MYRIAKRTIDLVTAFFALLLLAPALAALAIVIRMRMGGPVLFRQVRVGQNERRFVIVKFRTMTDARNSAGNLLGDQERLTLLGALIRRASLDELPQLWNVLKGDMSLVGPRPLLVEYLQRYNAFQRRRHEVKPGITGYAQVNGRNTLSWKQKFQLDVWYVQNASLWLDIQLFCRTIARALRCEGINQAGHATMPKFHGSLSNSPKK
jgi:lipopolysaccharide/colanic/teichoic acid biosynthesis glycosyltransferase